MEIMENKKIRNFYNKFIFLLTSLVKSKAIWFMLFIFPLLSLVVPVFLVPFWASGGFLVQCNVLLVSGLMYGRIIFGYKKSTLEKNEKNIDNSRTVWYVSALFIILLFVFLSSVVQLLLLIFLNKINFLIPNWFFAKGGDRGYSFSGLRYFAWFWNIILATLITFLIFFALRRFIKSERSHYNLTLAIIIVAFIWGGSLNDYWGESQQIGNTYERAISAALFPMSMYYPTLLIFPLFAPGQMASLIADFTITTDGEIWEYFSEYNQPIMHLSFNSLYNDRFAWNTLVLMPYVWILGLGTFGVLISENK